MRWLLLPVGLGIAALAAWLLLSAPASHDGLATRDEPTAATPRTPAVGASPGRGDAASRVPTRDHIDEASRRQLDAVLEREGIAP